MTREAGGLEAGSLADWGLEARNIGYSSHESLRVKQDFQIVAQQI
jgi:hypothetical protein